MLIRHAGMSSHPGGLTKLTLVVSGDRSQISDLVMAANEDPDTKPYEIDIRKQQKRRSLDANAYAWVLIDRLAQKLRLSKVEVYREAIRNIGGVSDIICIKSDAAQTLVKVWEGKGIGWQTELSESKIPGCTNVTLYYGSSVYSQEQMSALIDQLINECRSQGIETLTPVELEQIMRSSYGQQ